MIELPELYNLLSIAISAAVRAGFKILQVYNSDDFQVNLKSDRTPLTLADRLAHEEIKNSLSKTFIPVLSEEGRNILYEERKSWDYFWIVDPLDGTKEFIKRNGEFTVNIALIYEHVPIAGVVYVPVTGKLYFSLINEGAYLADNLLPTEDYSESVESIKKLAIRLPLATNRENFIIVESRSHSTPETIEFINRVQYKYNNVELLPIGSSLKMCLIAEGKADLYPRLSLSNEWDTAAGQAIVEGAGLSVKVYETNERLLYNKEELINPWFIVSNGRLNI
ncbi:3'(2'),5'-bisphosphate nucleotidase CysQ [Tenuifilum thalassicum]|uniref:3'(2'),5'-bisphosphate nucleotidase CysQ n=1 Tax=Tenuifilum thalassicum TaxID=2590900 RepID=A0A7D4BE26_9BACT|nr:3'(2'),5'-bisphosphate nucleotidase CysQ [Tenuifilum thalassicum]QKG79738.1 3'(2'),5'-bisphosphate nucleotidase CysQ [Tenuifilum thalassicum]